MSERGRRVKCEARGRVIYAGPTENDVAIGEVYDNGQPFPQEMAKIWAASFDTMFPVLAKIRDLCHALIGNVHNNIPPDLKITLAAIAELAGDALPVPTVGDADRAQEGK
jgi:hypothetical protein